LGTILKAKIFSKVSKNADESSKKDVGLKRSKLFDIDYRAALIRTATGAYMVWKPGITALGAIGQIRG
jgi:hypothetical protein